MKLSIVFLFAACCLLPAIGCDQAKQPDAVARLTETTKELATILTSVTNPTTAHDAAGRLDQAFRQFEAALAAEEAEGNEKSGSGNEDQVVESRLDESFSSVHQQIARIHRIKGLPADFWKVMREYSVREMRKFVTDHQKKGGDPEASEAKQTARMAAIYEKHGVERVAEVEVGAFERESYQRSCAGLRKVLGPQIEIVEAESQDGRQLVLLVAPVANFEDLVARIDFGRVTRSEKARGDICVDTKVAREPFPGFAESSAPFGEGDEDSDLRRSVRQSKDDVADVEIKDPAFREADRDSPHYHSQLASLLNDPRAHRHREAVSILAGMTPADVPDEGVRAEIARGFRELALNSPFHKEESIRGLVAWGGPECAPILVQVMEKSTTPSLEDALFEGMAKYPTSEGAKAMAVRLDNPFDRKKAMACLTQMGSVAEAAVIEVAPVEDLGINLFALDFLSDHGTGKSYPLLQKARKSPNLQIKEAALEALREIRLREQAKEKSEEKKAAA